MTRIFFLIRSLDHGGAERQLIELVRGLDKMRFDITVATFYNGGTLRSELENIPAVRVVSLQKKGRWDVIPFLWRLWRVVSAAQPHIIHGYMSIPNELSLLFGRLIGARVVWGLRVSGMDLTRYNWAVGLGFHLSRILSSFPDLIIVNSYMGRNDHIRAGYAADRMVVVSNGIDIEHFCPDPEGGYRVRAEWGIAPDELLIGMVGRLDPQKDHPTFLRAAALFVRTYPKARFVCVGRAMRPEYGLEIRRLAHELGLDQSFIWIDGRSDMPAVYNSLNLFTLSSAYGEGFANVLGEAMACGVPCVATDAGDARMIIGNTGFVTPIGAPRALAGAWAALCTLSDRSSLGAAARSRIVEQFSIETLVNQTVQLLDRTA